MEQWTTSEYNLVMQCIKNGNTIENIAKISGKSINSITERLQLHIYNEITVNKKTINDLSIEFKLNERVICGFYDDHMKKLVLLEKQRKEAQKPLNDFISKMKELLKLAPNGSLCNTICTQSDFVEKGYTKAVANSELYDYIKWKLSDAVDGSPYSVDFNPMENKLSCEYDDSYETISYTDVSVGVESKRNVMLRYGKSARGHGNRSYVLNFEPGN